MAGTPDTDYKLGLDWNSRTDGHWRLWLPDELYGTLASKAESPIQGTATVIELAFEIVFFVETPPPNCMDQVKYGFRICVNFLIYLPIGIFFINISTNIADI